MEYVQGGSGKCILESMCENEDGIRSQGQPTVDKIAGSSALGFRV